MIAQDVISAMVRAGTITTGRVELLWRKEAPGRYTAGHYTGVYVKLIQQRAFQWDWDVYLFGESVANGGNATPAAARRDVELVAQKIARIFGVIVTPTPQALP